MRVSDRCPPQSGNGSVHETATKYFADADLQPSTSGATLVRALKSWAFTDKVMAGHRSGTNWQFSGNCVISPGCQKRTTGYN